MNEKYMKRKINLIYNDCKNSGICIYSEDSIFVILTLVRMCLILLMPVFVLQKMSIFCQKQYLYSKQ